MRKLLISIIAIAGVAAFASIAQADCAGYHTAAKPLDVAGPVSTPIKPDTTTTTPNGG